MYYLALLAVTSAGLALLLTPVCRNIFLRSGWLDRRNSSNTQSLAVPRIGGIPIVLAYLASLALLLVVPVSTGGGVQNTLPAALKYLPAAALVFAIGLLDDIVELKIHWKLLGQVAATGLAIWAGVQIHGIAGHTFPTWVGVPVTMLWLIGCSNAFNLIDGVDGLAVGAGLFATVTTLAAGLMQHNLELVLVTVPLAGALLGFLRYNFNPASIFLGDCGSLLIGFLLGCFGILWSQKSATVLGMTAPLIAFAIPLLDTAVSMTRRFLRHQPVFGRGLDHIYHKLLQRGLSARRVVLLMYAACGLSAALSLVLSAAHDRYAGLIIIVFCAVAWLGIQHLGYAEFGLARRMVSAGTYRRLLNSQLTLQGELAAASDLDQVWNAIRRSYRLFGFHAVDFHINGNLYADQTVDGGARSWTARISLPCSDSVTLTRRTDADIPQIVAAYIDTLSSTLREKHPQLGASNPESIAHVRVAAAGK
jgi:UDP-GlcNAc:undecaprenyl-phosphate GlcNAc-1-phosphate transferase